MNMPQQRSIINDDSKSDPDRLDLVADELAYNSNDELASSKHKQHNLFHNHLKEENKSHRVARNTSSFNSPHQNQADLSNQRQQHPNQVMHSSGNSSSGGNNNYSNQRNAQHVTRSTTNPQLYQGTQFQPPQSFRLSSRQSIPLQKSAQIIDGTTALASNSRHDHILRRLSSPTGASTAVSCSHPKDNNDFKSKLDYRQHQRERESDEVVNDKKEMGSNYNFDSSTGADLDTLGSLERELPVELSFVIRQQAYCIARMNYLDRQIRELKESKNQHQCPTSSSIATMTASTPFYHHHLTQTTPQSAANQISQLNRLTTNVATTSATAASNNTGVHAKNGNFMPSDDSGGEYSRATISDDDELSSLLDQIAKSLRPDRTTANQNVSNISGSSSSNNNQLQQRTNYSVLNSHPPHHFAILTNPNQLHHHQPVPVFVMGSPIAVAHPSSINSNILPGVHFQPELRYNQYYEDFMVPNNNTPPSSSTTMNHGRHNASGFGHKPSRLQQFDSNLSALEQLVSQKEKRQIKSQLKTADNWFKMHSSGLYNINNNDLNDGLSSTVDNETRGTKSQSKEDAHNGKSESLFLADE